MGSFLVLFTGELSPEGTYPGLFPVYWGGNSRPVLLFSCIFFILDSSIIYKIDEFSQAGYPFVGYGEKPIFITIKAQILLRVWY
jgi:hypothetical protein